MASAVWPPLRCVQGRAPRTDSGGTPYGGGSVSQVAEPEGPRLVAEALVAVSQWAGGSGDSAAPDLPMESLQTTPRLGGDTGCQGHREPVSGGAGQDRKAVRRALL